MSICSTICSISKTTGIIRSNEDGRLLRARCRSRGALALFPVLLVWRLRHCVAFLPFAFAPYLLGYYALTLAYSIYLKRQVMVDVVVLARFTRRASSPAAAAIGVQLTFWLLAFSMFIFLSLAFVKRYAELHAMRERGSCKYAGRGYVGRATCR